jgi:hypothetical protein
MTKDNAVERIDRLNIQLASALRRRDSLDADIKQIQYEIAEIERGQDLPTEPGWYLTAENTPAHLDEDGTWDDGWGNSGPDYGPAWHPLPLRRLVPAAEGSE